MPWTVVRDVIDAALRASFIVLDTDSGPWPCELAGAQNVRLKVPSGRCRRRRNLKAQATRGPAGVVLPPRPNWSRTRFKTSATLIPELLKLKAKANLNVKFRIRLEVGNEAQPPDQAVIDQINKLLEGVQEGFGLKK